MLLGRNWKSKYKNHSIGHIDPIVAKEANVVPK